MEFKKVTTRWFGFLKCKSNREKTQMEGHSLRFRSLSKHKFKMYMQWCKCIILNNHDPFVITSWANNYTYDLQEMRQLRGQQHLTWQQISCVFGESLQLGSGWCLKYYWDMEWSEQLHTTYWCSCCWFLFGKIQNHCHIIFSNTCGMLSSIIVKTHVTYTKPYMHVNLIWNLSC